MSKSKEIILSGKKYISSKRAAKLAGYTNDYVGQLCREGKIEFQMVGRTRFVNKSSLLNYSEKLKGNEKQVSPEKNIFSQNKESLKKIFEKSSDIKNKISSSDYSVFGQKVLVTTLIVAITFGGYKFSDTPFAHAGFQKISSSVNAISETFANFVDDSSATIFGAGKKVTFDSGQIISDTGVKVALGINEAEKVSGGIILGSKNITLGLFENVSNIGVKVAHGFGDTSGKIILGMSSLNEEIFSAGKKVASGVLSISEKIISGADSLSVVTKNNISNVSGNFVAVQENGKDKVEGLSEKLVAYSRQLTDKNDERNEDAEEKLTADSLQLTAENNDAGLRRKSRAEALPHPSGRGKASLVISSQRRISEAVQSTTAGINSVVTSVVNFATSLTNGITTGINSSLAFVTNSTQNSIKNIYSIYRGYSDFVTDTSITFAKAEMDYINNIRTSGKRVLESVKIVKDVLIESPKLVVESFGKVSSIYRGGLEKVTFLGNKPTVDSQQLAGENNNDAGLRRHSAEAPFLAKTNSLEGIRDEEQSSSSTDFAKQNPSRISFGNSSQRGVERSGTTSLSSNDNSEATQKEITKNNSIITYVTNFVTNLTTSTKNKLASLFGSTKTKSGDITRNLALAINETEELSVNKVEGFAIDFYRTISGLFDKETTQVFVREEEVLDRDAVAREDESLDSSFAQRHEDGEAVDEVSQSETSSQREVERSGTTSLSSNNNSEAVQTIINPIQERIIQTTVERIVSGVTLADLQALNNELRSEIYRVSNESTTQTSNNYQAIALTNKIDNLSSVTINNSTITGGTITGATFGGSTLSLTGTVTAGSGTFSSGISATTGSFSGDLSTAGQLTISGTATSTMAGDFAFDTNTLYIDSVNNRVGIGTTSPSDTFAINGATYLAPISTPSVTTDRLYNVSNDLYWAGNLIGGATSANWTLSGSDAYRTTGNVGIGTTSPTYKLSVEGISSLGNQARAGYFTATTTTATSTFAGGLTVGTNFVIQQGNGNIGIGTTSPLTKLSVQATAGSPALNIASSTGASMLYVSENGYVGIGTKSPLSALHLPQENDKTTPTLSFGDGDTGIYEAVDDSIYFSIGGVGKIIINAEGIRGLVSNSGALSPSVASATVPAFRNSSDTNTGIGWADADQLSLIAGGTEWLRLDNTGSQAFFPTGNIGIGTTTPFAKLAVENTGSGNSFIVGDEADDSSPFVIDESGRVGIGTDSPARDLDISGSNGLSIRHPTTGNVTFEFLNGTTRKGLVFYQSSSNTFNIWDGSNSGITLDGSGNTGIGTSTPTHLLTVGTASGGSVCIDDGAGGCNGAGTTAGDIYYNAAHSSYADIAEKYPTEDDTLMAGEIVSLDLNNKINIKRAEEGEETLGIISTNPGLILGDNYSRAKGQPVALSGRVPVKVNLEGGEINIGDRVTLSSVAGVGMKASTTVRTVGIALEELTAESLQQTATSTPNTGLIMVFVENELTITTNIETLANKVDELEMRIADLEAQTTEETGSVSIQAMLSYMEGLGVKMMANVVEFKDVVAKKLTADKVVTNGIQMIDEVTGEVYCVKIQDGAMVNTQGTCESSDPNPADGQGSSQPTVDSNDEAPTILIQGNNPAQIEIGATYVDMGVIAQDSNGNDLSVKASVFASLGEAIQEEVSVSQINLDTSTSTTYIITYTTTDNNGTTVSVEREVRIGEFTDDSLQFIEPIEPTATTTPEVVEDITAPIILLMGSDNIEIELNETYIDEGATATDDTDGDVTTNIVINNLIDNTTAGTYTITYNVTDTVGNEAVEVIRIVVVKEAPVVIPEEIETASSTEEVI